MANYTNPTIDQEFNPKVVVYVDDRCAIFTCDASPEGVIVANTGSIALSDNGSVYKKTTDNVNTGWVELAAAAAVASPLTITGTNPTLVFQDTDVGDDDANISVQADVLSISIVGGTAVQLKASGQFIGIPRTLTVNTTPVGNVTTGLDPLQSFSLPANSLAANGDHLIVTYGGLLATNDNDKRVVLSIDGQLYEDPGLGLDLDGGAWKAIVHIVRTSATQVRVSSLITINRVEVSVTAGTPTLQPQTSRYENRNVLLTVANLNNNAVTLLVQGEGVATDDVTQTLSIIELVQMS